MEQTVQRERKIRIIPATKPVSAPGRASGSKQRVAAYCRVSTDSEEQLTSYTAQKDYYTQKIGENPDWEMAGIFADGGYTGKQQLIYLTRPQAEIALRYGIPIGVRDKHRTLMGTMPGNPFRYITIKDVKKLEKWLGFESTESLATIHADLPRGIQKKMREYILQIMEIECPECLPQPKPAAPLLGAYGNTFNLLCIANRALRQAGQIEQAEEMWRRVLDSGDSFKAISIMGEYVEFDEAYYPAATLCGGNLRGDLRV